MNLVWEINMGNIITILGLFGACIAAYTTIQWKLDYMDNNIVSMNKRMDVVNDTIAILNRTLNQVAVQDSRIAMLEKMVDELRHGVGFISKRKTR